MWPRYDVRPPPLEIDFDVMVRGRVRGDVDHLAACVLVLALAGERHGEHVTLRTGLHEVDAWVLHGDLKPKFPSTHSIVASWSPVPAWSELKTLVDQFWMWCSGSAHLLDDDLDDAECSDRSCRSGPCSPRCSARRILVADDQRPLNWPMFSALMRK